MCENRGVFTKYNKLIATNLDLVFNSTIRFSRMLSVAADVILNKTAVIICILTRSHRSQQSDEIMLDYRKQASVA